MLNHVKQRNQKAIGPGKLTEIFTDFCLVDIPENSIVIARLQNVSWQCFYFNFKINKLFRLDVIVHTLWGVF